MNKKYLEHFFFIIFLNPGQYTEPDRLQYPKRKEEKLAAAKTKPQRVSWLKISKECSSCNLTL